MGYVELHVRSNFTFLTGASHPDELAERAAELGHAAVAVTDVNTLAGVVRAHMAAKAAKLPLLVGAEVQLLGTTPKGARDCATGARDCATGARDCATDAGRDAPTPGSRAVLFALDRDGYGNLSHLLTVGRRRVPKGQCEIVFDDLPALSRGVLAVLLGPDTRAVLAGSPLGTRPLDAAVLGAWREVFGDRLYLGLSRLLDAGDVRRTQQLAALAAGAGVPTVAVNSVELHVRERKLLHDVLACIREKRTLETAGFALQPNAEAVLKSPLAMQRLFHDMPDAVARTLEVAQRITAGGFALDQLRFEYPDEYVPPGESPADYLRRLTFDGGATRYRDGIPPHVVARVEHELALIAELKYEPYFLTIFDAVRFARERNILCQGRGSAANSAVCFCLGITAVDPATSELLFERFISRERNEPPDIDVDFEHERREEVIQYIYGKYGRDRAAMVCEVIRYRGRSALREVGKAFGLSLDQVDRLTKLRMHHSDGLFEIDDVADDGSTDARERRRRRNADLAELRRAGLDPASRRVRLALRTAGEIQDFPRHLSIHVGGFVITRGPIHNLVPVENAAMADRTVIQWDKNDAEALGLLKVDCLALGMLTAVRKCFGLIEETDLVDFDLASVPNDDAATWAMIQRADTVGVFQIESRGQMSMLVRLKPACFYDLVIEVAIMRPGPIQGGMVHPYLRRRQGLERVEYPLPQLEQVLKRTLGVPLFQEQCMQLAVVAAGFTPGEADQLRRAMAAWRKRGEIDKLRDKLLAGMRAKGIPDVYAERVISQIQGFGEYGFPESHAASFALIAWVSCYLKCHWPAHFIAALINSQPMGFYSVSALIQDVKRHDVEVRPVDVTASDYDCTLEPLPPTPDAWFGPPALRLGLRVVRGFSPERADALVAARRERPFHSVADFARRSGLDRGLIQRLADAGALASLRADRREAVWDATWDHELDKQQPLFAGLEPPGEPPPLRPYTDAEIVAADYSNTGLSLHRHPMQLLRHRLPADTLTCEQTRQSPDGRRVRVAGLVQTRQRPSTAKGVTFITLEDETGNCQLIVWLATFNTYRAEVYSGRSLLAEGTVQQADNVMHLIVDRLQTLDSLLNTHHLAAGIASRDFC